MKLEIKEIQVSMMTIYRSDWLALGGETTVKMVLLFLFLPLLSFLLYVHVSFVNDKFLFLHALMRVCVCVIVVYGHRLESLLLAA